MIDKSLYPSYPELTTVNGVEFTSDMFCVLDKWQACSKKEEGLPAIYVDYLGDVQDYLSLLMADFGENIEKERITRLLCHLIHIKEDMKCFIHAQKPID